ncbi:hypothetical protein J4448_05085 [Candidatus Woesearchaeota archaeon]|nr:hypothetical protein [Candidatus Woesearchaeota archaeon]
MYRENIYDVIKATGERVTTLVIPKNTGLKGYAWQVLKEAGLDLGNAKQIDKATLKVGDIDITLLLRRGEDIPQIVMDEFRLGNIVLGVTGDDLLDEYRLRNPENTLKVENTYDWYDENARFNRPALSFVNRNGDVNDIPIEARVAVNGKYEYNGRLYLSKSPLLKGRKFILTVYNGDLEDRVAKGANDCCIDTVYTGTTIDTIDEYGLRIVEIIRFSDLVVISALRKDSSKLLELMAKDIPRGPVIERNKFS